jgi:two-component system response regulator MprA
MIGTRPANDSLAKLEMCLLAISSTATMKERILVVDDDPAVRESLKRLLLQNDYDVSLASDGEEAERWLGSHSTELVLLDLEMPRRDGWEVFEKLQSTGSAIPVIMITGLADQLETKQIPGVGALLEKPIDAKELLKRIETLLREGVAARSSNEKLESNRSFTPRSPGYLSFQAANGMNGF